MTFLSNWITIRLNYLDIQYLKSKYTDVTEMNQPTIKFSPNPVINMVTVYNTNAGDIVQIISIQGTELSRTISDGCNTMIDMTGYTPGIYFIKAGNYISKVIKR